MSALSTAPAPALAPDPSSDFLHVERHPLDPFFHPRSIAVIGATEKEGSVGRTILWNLLSSPFGGTVYPVNPMRPAILGVKAYRSIGAIGEPVDLAVIVTPAKSAPGLIEECGAGRRPGVVIISAGFKEIGPEGVELERQVLETARRHGIRVIGPNCLGIMNPVGAMNATFAVGIAKPGRVGLHLAVGRPADRDPRLGGAWRTSGFSSIVSLGSMLDVGWGDVIDYLGDDPNTDSIVIYMETIGDARAFLSAARAVALTKPIIVIKPGRTAQAAKAAASHTGSLTGSDDVLDAAFRRAGVLRVDSISELFMVSEILAKQPRPAGRRLSIVTNAGGPGVIATDALISGGGELTDLTARDDGAPQRRPAGRLEPQQPDRHHRRRAAGPLRQGARDRGGRPGHGRPAGHPHPAGDDGPDRHRQGARGLREDPGQAGPRFLDGRHRRRSRAPRSCARPASRRSPTRTPRASCSTTSGATRTTSARCTRRRPCRSPRNAASSARASTTSSPTSPPRVARS